MISINGLIQKDSQLPIENNRGFLFGDGLFDTLIYKNKKFVFLEAHYFRLLASMRQLRMEIPAFFTQDYWEEQMLKTIKANSLQNSRVRTTVFRDSEGLYSPNSNKIQFIIQVKALTVSPNPTNKLGVYKDNFISSSPISNLKTTNRITNILASIFAKENRFDSCLILNHRKQVAEVTHANIFLVFDNKIVTPPLSDGGIDGILRIKIIDILKKEEQWVIQEKSIYPFDLNKADEVFISNSVIGIQGITLFKKKKYATRVSKILEEKLTELIENE